MTQSTVPTPPSRTWLALGILAVVVVTHMVLMRVGWTASGLIGQEFRQTQTAISCYFSQIDGYKLDYPTPVLGKPWSAPMEFPLYQWATAAWANRTGAPIYIAGRWVSVLCFYAALPALFLLLRRLGLQLYQSALALALIIASPIYIFFSRAVLIESMAILTSAWTLYFVIQCIEARRRLWLWVLGAWIVGASAVLIKITTWTGWMLPAVFLTLWHLLQAWRAPQRSWARLTSIAGRALLATVPVFLVGMMWTRYADAVKSANPAAVFLLSSNLNQWNFGTLDLRFSAKFWISVWRNVTNTQVAAPLLLAALPLLFFQAGTWRLLVFTLGIFVATLMTFTNLYFLHDYYYYSNAIFLVAACAIVIVKVFDTGLARPWAAWTLAVFAIGLQFGVYYRDYYQTQKIDFYGGNGLTQALEATTQKDDVIVIYGDDWASMIPYYSHRRALMIPGWREHDEASIAKSIKLLEGERVVYLVMKGASRTLLDAIEARRKDLDINPHLLFSHEPTGVNVYAKMSEVDRIARQVATGGYHGVKLAQRPGDVPPPARGISNQLAPVTEELKKSFFYMMSPAPKLYMIPYELGIYTSATGKARFSAHAGTDLIFEIPQGAREATGTFGVLEGAYTEGATKGIQFEVILRKRNEADQVVFSLFLEPRFTPADRGAKQFKVAIPAGYAGHELIFRSKAGPTGDASYGWGFIEQLTIK